MFPFAIFIFSALLLSMEGGAALNYLNVNLSGIEKWSLGFAAGAFINVLLFFALTILKVQFSFAAVYGAHAFILILLYFLPRRKPATGSSARRTQPFGVPTTRLGKAAFGMLVVSITIKLLYAFSHAVLIPSYYYDTLSQWNMRAKVSYVDRAIAFDADEARGMSKPQYPILAHSLQIFFMLPQNGWSDRIANSATLALSASSFIAFAMLLSSIISPFAALAAMGLIFMIPLVALHLGQGYGDIHVIEYMLLSAACMLLSSKNFRSWMLLSSIFVVASAWVKIEGTIFGAIPWLIIFFASMAPLRKMRLRDCRSSQPSVIFSRGDGGILRRLIPLLPILLLLPWPLLILSKGLPLSPHPGDTVFAWHPDAVQRALSALFSYGSFGIFWYAVPLSFVISVVLLRGRSCEHFPELMILAWGIMAFFAALFVYLFTPNVQFLINGQAFHRTMMIPLAIMLLGIVALLAKYEERHTR